MNMLAAHGLHDNLSRFQELGRTTVCEMRELGSKLMPVYVNEFWTAKQRDAHPLHEISYRACFKPQVPRFFIERLSQPGDTVYDPFSGRGTTALEAALLGRRALANDVNPLSRMLAEPRFQPPAIEDVAARLEEIPRTCADEADVDLAMFYQPDTLAEIVALRAYLQSRKEDAIDRWIRMVATNRLTGHSPGFFSVYTFPPNQAVGADAQRRINLRRNQTPEYRDTHALILKKSRALLKAVTDEERASLKAARPRFLECDARATPAIADRSVKLTVTSPPFLDVVQYGDDNWLRCWFNGIAADEVGPKITATSRLAEWTVLIGATMCELHRITSRGGHVAFEVGEVRGGSVRLEEHVVPAAIAAGFECEGVLIHEQNFTKTAHIWGVANNRAGTNSNRVVLLRRR
jgi:hypothetical protein